MVLVPRRQLNWSIWRRRQRWWWWWDRRTYGTFISLVINLLQWIYHISRCVVRHWNVPYGEILFGLWASRCLGPVMHMHENCYQQNESRNIERNKNYLSVECDTQRIHTLSKRNEHASPLRRITALFSRRPNQLIYAHEILFYKF